MPYNASMAVFFVRITMTKKEETVKLQNKTRIQFNANPDLQLKFRIRRTLHAAGYAVLNAIRIEVHHGEVYLEGTVTSYFMKQMAQALIMTLDEVRKTYNFLIVDTAGQQPDVKLTTDHACPVEYSSKNIAQADQSKLPEADELPLRLFKAE